MVSTSGTLLEGLPEDERRRVLTTMRRRRFVPGEVIFHEGDLGDTLHVIEAGHVAIRVTTPLGDVATFTVLGPGSAFGEGSFFNSDTRRSASAVAIGPTQTRSIGRDAFASLRREQPRVEQFLVALLAAQVRRLSELVVEVMYVPVETRVLRRLAALAHDFAGSDAGPAVVVPLTQDDLATLAGTTRPTANRVLKQAEADGLITLSRGRIHVLDAGALARRAR